MNGLRNNIRNSLKAKDLNIGSLNKPYNKKVWSWKYIELMIAYLRSQMAASNQGSVINTSANDQFFFQSAPTIFQEHMKQSLPSNASIL